MAEYIGVADRSADRSGEPDEWGRLLEAAAKAVTITALALPAIGVAIRWLSYLLGGMPPGFAVQASIPELALAGISGLSAVGVGVLFAAWTGRRFGSRRGLHAPALELSPRAYQTFRVLFLLPLAVLAVALPVMLPAVVAGFVYGKAIARWTAGEERFRAILPALLAALVISAIGHGIIPRTTEPVLVRMRGPDAPLSGWYSPLGQDSVFLYAYSCMADAAMALPLSTIDAMEYGEADPLWSPRTWDVLVRGEQFLLGYVPSCPTAEATIDVQSSRA